VHPSKLHGIRLLISPMISGLVLGGIGRTVRHRGPHSGSNREFWPRFHLCFWHGVDPASDGALTH